LLCRPCNLLLGLAKDDSAVLEAASQYLERFNTDEGTPDESSS
jgi:hypothetical protein